jgi:outer membrane protein assembly factor BamB
MFVPPGIAAAALIVIGFSLPIAIPDAGMPGLLGAMVSALAVVFWWLLFSRARWSERLGAIALLIAAWFATRPFLHMSIIGGAMGALPVLAFPVLAAALGIWAWATRNLSDGVRRVSLVAAILLASGLCTTVRTAGLGPGGFEFHWRWTPTPEERLLARGNDDPAPIPPAPLTTDPTKGTPAAEANTDPIETPPLPPAPRKSAAWPGFRGPGRDGVVHGVRINTDWATSPPVELWRRAVGPGWSSFAVDGDRIYTQEQRGDDEIVACYSLATGKPLWMHRDPTRFWESNGGPGPRATPAVSNGRVYAFGATGIVNALDATSGAVVWQRNAAADTGAKIPDWGFSSSPLVVDDVVIVAVAGQLAGYERASGAPRWTGKDNGFSYSSPHLLTIDGVQQAVLLTGRVTTSVVPADGTVLWQHMWEGGAIVQPAVIADGDILINSIAWTGGAGTRRLTIKHGPEGWSVAERWTSNALKPYYNDFVIHKGHAFGFDGSILASIDLADGKRKWKGGRYGAGQLVLLAEQDVLLVLSEEGELALVSATPDKFTEIARAPAIEGKTWNHPVLVGDILLVRNGEEMAAFRLATVE